MIFLVEQAVLSPYLLECPHHPKAMKGWRCYRIEYDFECLCPDGEIWLPSNVDSGRVEDYLNRLCKTGVPNE